MDIDSSLLTPSQEDLHDALQEIALICQQPPKEREDASPYVQQITAYARTHGLSNDALTTLVPVILGPSRLDNASCNALASELYPAERIPSSVVYGVVAKLGSGARKAAPGVQAQMLRWLVLVADLVEDGSGGSRAVSRLYGALFGLLDVTALRDQACLLLCRFTEPQHVQAHRATALKEMRKTPSASEYVTALLVCYHAIRPDLVPEELCAGKVASLDCPDPAWRDRLEAIQEDAIMSALSRDSESQFRVAQRTVTGKRRARRHLVETDTSGDGGSGGGGEGLEGVTGVRDFVRKLPSIVRPSDMEAVLDDPLLQQYMATGPDDIAELDGEVDEILAAMFERELESVRAGKPLSLRAVQTLRKVLEYAQFQKFLPGSIEKFVVEILRIDQGGNHFGLLLDLLTWRYPDSHAWEDSILSTEIEENILKRGQRSAEDLLKHYAAVLRNRTAMLMSGTSAFEGAPGDDPTALTDHASYLATSLLARSSSQRTISTIVSYLLTLAAISKLSSADNTVPIFSFDAVMVYTILFANPTVSTLSNVLSLLADYKQVVESSIVKNPNQPQSQPQSQASKFPPDFIKRLNGFLMDCCNLIWRSRAFSTQSGDRNAAGCMLKSASELELARYISQMHPDYALAGAFGLACHPALAGMAAGAWTEIEASKLGISIEELRKKRQDYRDHKGNAMEVDGKNGGESNGLAQEDDIQAVHAGPVSRASLQRLEAAGGAMISWSQYRLSVLDWLDHRGSDGIGKLMKRTITLLMGKSEPNSSQASPATVAPIDTPMTTE